MFSTIAMLLVVWWAVTALHEFSHIFVGVAWHGFKLTDLQLLWHWYDPATGLSRVWRPWELWRRPRGFQHFYFARYAMDGDWPMYPHAFIHVVPLVLSSVLMTLHLALAMVFQYQFFWWFAAGHAIDGLIWCLGAFSRNPNTDAQQYINGTNV